MNPLKYIYNKIVLLEVAIGDNYTDVALSIAKYKKGGFTRQPKEYLGNSLEKWKNGVAILSITGEHIVSRTCRADDPAVKKVMENKQLIWSLDGNTATDSETITISFLRREFVNDIIALLEKNKIYIAQMWIKESSERNKDDKILSFFNNKTKLSAVKESKSELNLSAGLLYHKIKLPVLLVVFGILFVNFFLNNNIRKEYEQNQVILSTKQRQNKIEAQRAENNKISAEYAKIPNLSYALISDRIASYVPDNVRLSQMVLFPIGKNSPREKGVNIDPRSVKIKGEVDIPGNVTLFSQFLSADNLFSSVEIVSLSRREGSSIYDFELLATTR